MRQLRRDQKRRGPQEIDARAHRENEKQAGGREDPRIDVRRKRDVPEKIHARAGKGQDEEYYRTQSKVKPSRGVVD